MSDWLRELSAWVGAYTPLLTHPVVLVVATVATLIGGFVALVQLVLWVARLFGRRAEAGRVASNPGDPALSDPPASGTSLTRYNARAVELLGRDDALARLKAFVATPGGFAWMQVAGVGGQGKSRLALEVILWLGQRRWWQRRWRAGLLDGADLKAFQQHWATWQPRQPHLLVVDYVIGREARIKPLIETLARRADSLRRPVRLLLLERQRWDRGGLGALARRRADGDGSNADRGAGRAPTLDFGGEGRADWYLKLAERPWDGDDPPLTHTRYGDGVLELTRLEAADLVTIVRRIARLELARHKAMGSGFTAEQAGTETALPDADLTAQLARIDAAGRPLYAYLLGLALAAGGDPRRGWTREDLLTATLARDQGSRWRAALGGAAPCLGDGSPAERLAVLATITGGLDCAAATRAGRLDHPDAATRRAALVLTDGPLGNPADPGQVIPPLLPDLLGEWLVLSAFGAGLPFDDLLDRAWRLAPDGTAAFLQRLTQDFPDQQVTADLLAREPPDGTALAALGRVASAIIFNLDRAKRPFPAPVIAALTSAAESGDGLAMFNVGICYKRGWGVERDLAEAVAWYQRSAEAGYGGAMGNLGVCYGKGEGVERDLAQAVAWYRKGAEASDGRAMANLGHCYKRGEGVERDLAQAVAWYRKGVEAGDGWAMALLGLCYERGEGVERDLAQAVAWYRKGAEAGDGQAMASLGVCYDRGEGVEHDPAQAVAWHRKGAEAGHGPAMANLGVCYQRGEGVECDLGQAVAWYRKAADAGNGRAMANLGYCYERGEGVEPDLAQAVTWYRKGAEAGDGWAMAALAWSYARGEGIERDLAGALDWYRRADAAGHADAAAVLHRLETALALIGKPTPPDPADQAWGRRAAAMLGPAPWADRPPVSGDWETLTGPAAVAVLARLRVRLLDVIGAEAVAGIAVQRIRRLPLGCYPGCAMVDLQLRWPGQNGPALATGLVSEGGAALLDGTSQLIRLINPDLLRLADDAAVVAYLRFSCAMIRGEEGPFFIVDSVADVPMTTANHAALSEATRAAISPPRLLDGDLSRDGWRRVEACELYGTALFRAPFKVLAGGMVEMESVELIATNLPVRRCRYDGPFRFPPPGTHAD